MFEKIRELYINEYKKLLIIPILILLLSLAHLGYNYYKTGDFIEKDVSLKGGITASIYTDKDYGELEKDLSKKFNTGFLVRKLTEFGTERQNGFIIETSNVNEDDLKKTIEEKLDIKLTKENFSIESTGSSLSQSFYKQMLFAMALAFGFMSIVVFLIFRTFVPSFAVILSAFADIVETVALIDLIGVKLSTGAIAALLLLIGYSVDTDILLTTNVIKRKEGSIDDRIFKSIKTGMMMTLTAIAAVTIGYFISNSFLLKDIFLIILIGLLFDIFNTWITNTAILKAYILRKVEHEKIS
ncbi:hypothetical protein HYX19_04650 [Candidatus Woesearchaeota archaeon]|nr:hypothetical protein [Candidatus Woesearchaeota archaeon]